jgi:hypothetical protein
MPDFLLQCRYKKLIWISLCFRSMAHDSASRAGVNVADLQLYSLDPHSQRPHLRDLAAAKTRRFYTYGTISLFSSADMTLHLSQARIPGKPGNAGNRRGL